MNALQQTGRRQLFATLRHAVRTEGLMAAGRRCLLAPIRRIARWRERYSRWRLAHSTDPKVVFELVHKLNVWDDAESVSGPGSTLAYTANLRRHLRTLFAEFSIASVFDAPCGDFNWMRLVLAENRIRYIGGDIVPALIRTHQAAHGGPHTRFLVFDLTRDRFPTADLWFCRDCLFHLSYHDIYAALANFSRSEVRAVLFTNHRPTVPFENCDIRTGGFRKLDLMAPPFNLPRAVKCRIKEGTPDNDTGHEMCLWDREQIAAALPAMKRALNATDPSRA